MTFTGPSALLGRTPLRQIADGSEFPRNHRNITMSLGAIVQRIDGIARNVISERDASDNRGNAYAEHEDFPPEHQLSVRSEEGALIAGGQPNNERSTSRRAGVKDTRRHAAIPKKSLGVTLQPVASAIFSMISVSGTRPFRYRRTASVLTPILAAN
jgi:hypothetical protein